MLATTAPGPGHGHGRARASARSTGAVLLAIAAGSVLALVVWGTSPYARYLDHDEAPSSVAGQAGALALFVVGWALMITATMLPTATELVGAVGRLADDPVRRRKLQRTVVAGFVAVWLAVGYGFRLGDVLVHTVVGWWPWLEARPEVVGATTLLVAAGFQFSELKGRCLTACRTPHSFVYRHWRGGDPVGDAWRIGVAYGVSCVGCCWALMLVMFGLGAGNVGWMLGIGAVVAAEKASASRRLGRWLGITLVGAAVVTLLWERWVG